MPSAFLLARTTIAAAFHRTKARMRRSMYSSPGNHGSFSRGMVLTYGVLTVAGKLTCVALARSSNFDRRNRARVLPCTSTTASRESSHSCVSPGSESGSWLTKPSKIMLLVNQAYRWVTRANVLGNPPSGGVEQHVRGDQRCDAHIAARREADGQRVGDHRAARGIDRRRLAGRLTAGGSGEVTADARGHDRDGARHGHGIVRRGADLDGLA